MRSVSSRGSPREERLQQQHCHQQCRYRGWIQACELHVELWRGAIAIPGPCPDPMLIEHLAVAVAIAQCRDFSLGSALQGRPTSCMMSGGIVQARKDAASRLECLHVQAAVMRLAGHESVLMLHTKCSRCPKPNTSRRRAGCIIAAANGQSSRESPRRRPPVVER